MPVSIIAILPQQAEELSELCQQIYREVYPYLWHDGGEWYMKTRYNMLQLKTEIEHPNVAYYFVKNTDNQPIGHLKLNLDSNAIAGNTESYGDSSTKLYDPKIAQEMAALNGLELERIYFLSNATGKGMGQETLDFVLKEARLLHKDYVWLHVMDSSPAKKFYGRNGFTTCGETILPFELMKPQYRRMFKMWKKCNL